MNYNKIVSLVYEAGKLAFAENLDTKIKNDNPNDFVTAVDMAISDFMKDALYKECPDVGFVTEEENDHEYKEKSFILDPIDGTTNLVYDYKMSSVSLAYQEKGDVKFGVVYNPFSKEIFFAIKGRGAHLYKADNGIDELLKIGVENYTDGTLKASSRPIDRSIIEFGATVSNKAMADQNFERAKRVFKACVDLRRTCSTALAISYIAAGRLDGYFEISIKPWDYAAGILILEEAGGTSCNWKGEKLPLDQKGSIMACNGVIREDLLKLINQ